MASGIDGSNAFSSSSSSSPVGKLAPTQKDPSSISSVGRVQKQQNKVVDDWDAESSDDEPTPLDAFEKTNKEWVKANSQTPTSVPIMSTNQIRTLPSSAYGTGFVTLASSETLSSRNGSSSSQSSIAPPKILQRPKNVAPGVTSTSTSSLSGSSDSQVQRKTVEQRQQEYRIARARIFGETTPDVST